MTNRLLIIIGLIVGLFTTTTARELYSWKLYLPYGDAIDVVEAGDYIYAATPYSVFRYYKPDGSVELLDKVSGLSDQGMQDISYEPESETVILVYNNGNIDLIKDENTIINLSDLKEKVIAGDKQVYAIDNVDGMTFLSTGFGLLQMDADNEVFPETYYLGSAGGALKVVGLAANSTHYFAATEEGVKMAPKIGVNLSDYSNWELQTPADGLPLEEATDIVGFNGQVYVAMGNTLYQYDIGGWLDATIDTSWSIKNMEVSNGSLVCVEKIDTNDAEVQPSRIGVYDGSFNAEYLSDPKMQVPLVAVQAANGNLWVADFYVGLQRVEGGQMKTVKPNGPGTINAFEVLATASGTLAVAPGGHDASWDYTYNANGFFLLKDNWWSNFNFYVYPAISNYWDLIAVAEGPSGKLYFASYYNGLVEYDDGEVAVYSSDNSPLEDAIGSPGRTRVSDVQVDEAGNLWLLNHQSENPLKVKTKDGDWFGFSPTPGKTSYETLLIDQYSQKWVAASAPGIGLVVYDEGSDLESASDDVSRVLNSSTGSGALPNLGVNCLAEDRDGEIWVGTDEGIAVFYCGGSVLTNGCDAQQIIVERDGYNGLLFGTDVVKSIAVDGYNRKWVGTTSGLWLISEDGKEEIFAFKTNNSPLPSNVINDITIDPNTGEVFVATEEGLISFMGDATEGKVEQDDEVFVYPNPVQPDYEGSIAISGLADNSYFKITDAFGGLVYQGDVFGGQAIWDGKDYNGDRAKSGVYLVFSSNEDGSQTYVAKFVMVN